MWNYQNINYILKGEDSHRKVREVIEAVWEALNGAELEIPPGICQSKKKSKILGYLVDSRLHSRSSRCFKKNKINIDAINTDAPKNIYHDFL